MNTLAKFHNNLPSSFLDFHQFVRKFPCFFQVIFPYIFTKNARSGQLCHVIYWQPLAVEMKVSPFWKLHK